MNKKSMKITKNTYLKCFSCIVLVLALVRCVFPSVSRQSNVLSSQGDPDSIILARADSVNKARQAQRELELRKAEEKANNAKNETHADAAPTEPSPASVAAPEEEVKSLKYFNADGTPVKHRIFSVPSYRDAFPDMQDVQIYAGDYVIVLVECDDCVWRHKFLVDADMTLTGGKCHTLTVDSGWEPSPADYTQYGYDGEVVTLQENNKGLDLVIMGDGFIAEDFDGGDNSVYMSIMRNAAEQFFKVPPYDYLKPFFNVYIVKAVSPERTNAETTGMNGARNTGSETKFSVSFVPNSTSVSGDNTMVFEYASRALEPDDDGKRLANATMIVIANQPCRSGTCYSGWGGDAYNVDYGLAYSIAYMGLGKNTEEGNQLVRHEAGGHGFGKLADEYTGYSLTNTGPWNTLAQYHPMGFSRNVDRYVDERNHAALGDSYPVTTAGNVYWADLFGTVNNYEQTESLGVFEGGMVYNNGICRPTENPSCSIMNANTGIFNAPSRRQILYRAKCLMGTNEGSWGSAEELAAFLAWDAEHFQPNVSDYLPARAPGKRPNSVEQYAMPFAPPVMVYGRWEGKRFIPIENEHN